MLTAERDARAPAQRRDNSDPRRSTRHEARSSRPPRRRTRTRPRARSGSPTRWPPITRLRTWSGVRRCRMPCSATPPIPSPVPAPTMSPTASGNHGATPISPRQRPTKTTPQINARDSCRSRRYRWARKEPSAAPPPHPAFSSPYPIAPAPSSSTSGDLGHQREPAPSSSTTHASVIAPQHPIAQQEDDPVAEPSEAVVFVPLPRERPRRRRDQPRRTDERHRVQAEHPVAGRLQLLGCGVGREDRNEDATEDRPDQVPDVAADRHHAVRPRQILRADQVRHRGRATPTRSAIRASP